MARPNASAIATARAPTPPAPALQRARGHARVAASGPDSALAELAQAGSARLLFPRRAAPGALEAVVVNVGGGLADGDRFGIEARASDGARLALTTQACEKAYRARAEAGGVAPARASVRLEARAGAALHWLPQETILFDGARLRRRLDVALDATARLVAVEAVLLGRPARGEAWREGRLEDSWRVRREGRLVFAEALSLEPEDVPRVTALRGAGAFATLLLAAPDAESRLGALRAALGVAPAPLIPSDDPPPDNPPPEDAPPPVEGVDAGASAFDGLLLARLAARDGLSLRRALLRALPVLTDAPPPRAWAL